MALPGSSVATVCSWIGSFVRSGLNAAANNISVQIGAPSEIPDSTNDHYLNLFFYRFEPGSFQSVTHPQDPWRIRMFCLVTSFGIDDDGIPAGENELRMIGEVMRIFHEAPVSAEIDLGMERIRLQLLFSPANDEQINQIWSTQGDKTYRPSVVYEIALVPVIPSTPRSEAPRVGAIGQQAYADLSQANAPFTGATAGPVVRRERVNTGNPLWTPHLVWVDAGELAYTLSVDTDDPGFGSFVPSIWIAGDSAETVDLEWQIWDGSQWAEDDSLTTSGNPFSDVIDPDNIPALIPATFPHELAIPVSIAAGETSAQALLVATRSVTLVPSSNPITVRSNPLLLTLYRVAP